MEHPPTIVIHTSPLTLQDISLLGHDVELENYFMFGEYESNEDLIDSDFIIGNICFENSDKRDQKQDTYTLIHGFPGDVPMGAVFNQTDLYFIGYDVQHKTNNQIDRKIKQWYAEVTKECTDFKESHWYTQPTDEV